MRTQPNKMNPTLPGALLGLLLLGVAVTGGAQPIAGRYVNAEGRAIEPKADGTFVASPPFGTVEGTYTVKGTDVTLRFTRLGFTDTCTWQGATLTNRAGQRFVKGPGDAPR